MKYTIKILILLGIFIASIYFFGSNMDEAMFGSVKTTVMEDAKLPTMELKSDGVTGISMAAVHLKKDADATLLDIVKHIEHYCSLGGENYICLGCDFDGISSSPKEIQNMYDLPLLAEHLARLGYSDCQIEGFFYKNADRFLKKISV